MTYVHRDQPCYRRSHLVGPAVGIGIVQGGAETSCTATGSAEVVHYTAGLSLGGRIVVVEEEGRYMKSHWSPVYAEVHCSSFHCVMVLGKMVPSITASSVVGDTFGSWGLTGVRSSNPSATAQCQTEQQKPCAPGPWARYLS